MTSQKFLISIAADSVKTNNTLSSHTAAYNSRTHGAYKEEVHR